MTRPDYDDLNADTQGKINGAVITFLRDGGHPNLAAATGTLGMEPQELWSMIVIEAGLPDCVPPQMIQVGWNQ